MSNKIAVKIKTDKVIDGLVKALASRKQQFIDSAKSDLEYEKAKEKYASELIKLAKSAKAVITEVNTYERWHNKGKDKEAELSVTIKVPRSLLPKEPENKSYYHERIYQSEVEDINNALRLLRMTDQEYVNASTMKSVSQYL